jgi:GTP-binding protein Era
MDNSNRPFRSGYVAIIGEPNVGKSTLMNALLQQKLSIVTKKPQTTRHRVVGILSGEGYQVIFLDTPGLLQPQYLLHEAMMDSARAAVSGADVLLILVDATKPPGMSEWIIVREVTKPFTGRIILAINKIDLVMKNDLLPLIDASSKQISSSEIIPISALTLDGVDRLKNVLVDELPDHPPYYPLDMVTDQSERFFVSEIIREKIFEKFRQEIPYSTTVEIIEFKEREGEKDLIRAEAYVERESQKGILIGKGGKALKEIGELSRKDIEKFLGRGVFLELHIKVREGWRNSTAWLKRLGYSRTDA